MRRRDFLAMAAAAAVWPVAARAATYPLRSIKLVIGFPAGGPLDVVSRLSTRGLIRSTRDTRDGRRKTISLTPKGLHTVQQLIPRTHAMTDRLVGPLDQRQRDELLCLLTKVVGANERR